MKRTNSTAPLFSFLLCAAFLIPQVGAQDIAGELLGGDFTYSRERSASHGQIMVQATGFVFGQAGDLRVEVGIYEFDGTFEQAVERIPVSDDSDVSEITEQYPGAGLGMFLAMFEGRSDIGPNGQWLENARSAVTRWEDARYRSYKVSQGEGSLRGEQDISPGDMVEIFSLECQSPFIDYGDLQIHPGTWIVATRIRFTVPEDTGDADDSGFDWDDDESGGFGELAVPLYPGAKQVDPDATSYSALFGEQNYLAKGPVAEVKAFYLNMDGQFCSIDDESPMAFEEGEIMMTSLLCLDHEGEAGAGDHVTAISLFKAPPRILSDLIGRTQGDWTVIIFNSWVEEEY